MMPVRRTHVLELRSVRGTGGGPEKTILLGTHRADRDRYRVIVCYIRDVRDTVFGIDDQARALGIEYVEVRERHSFDRSIWRTLKTLIADESIDIVHAHDYKTNLLAWLLAKRVGIAPLSTVHGWTGDSPRERYLYYPADKRVLSRFPRAIAVSTDIKNELVRCGADAGRITVILNAIDGEKFQRQPGREAEVRRRIGLDPAWTVVGAVGRVERQKRFDLLLEAMAPLFRAEPALHLVVVGEGSLREALESQALTLGVQNQCHWLGHRTDVADLHHAFDLYVQASEYEGTPNTVLEAMAMRTPIVATDVGGTREIARPDVHALIVPPHDVPALRAAMAAALARTPDVGRRVDAARQRIEDELSFEARTRQLECIYAEIMAAGLSRRRVSDGRSYA